MKPLTVEIISNPRPGPSEAHDTSVEQPDRHDQARFSIYRYDPDKDAKPYMQTLEVELDGSERMLLDALMKHQGD